MSLMLRKNCQEILDKFNLSTYHVEINGNKTLAVVGECGKPLFTIHSIKFNRNTPTNNEIEYATTLFNEFMYKHKAIIEDYLKKKSAFSKVKEVTSDKYTINISGNNSYIKFNYIDNDFTYLKYFPLTSKTIVNINTSYSLDTLNKLISEFNKELPAMKELGKNLVTYANKQKDIEEALSKLNNCSI